MDRFKKLFLFAVLTIAFAWAVYPAQAAKIPFTPEGDARFEKQERQSLAIAYYDYAVDGGAIGAHKLGVKIPAGAVISQASINVTEEIVETTSTVALHCEDANNIYTGAVILGTGFKATNVTGAATAMVGNIAADCEVTATIAVAPVTAGKFWVFIEYFRPVVGGF